MKCAWAMAAVLAMALLGAGGSRAQAPEKKDEISVTGEVVDLHCYLTRGARGPEHAGCANACLARGVTAGLRTEDGRVFILLGERPFPIKEQVAGLAGETVVVTGTLVERDGMRGLRLGTVRRSDTSR